MSEAIIIAIIGAIGSIIGALIAAFGRLGAATIEQQLEAEPRKRPGLPLWVGGIVIGGILGILVGALLVQVIGTVITKWNTPAIPLEIAFRYDFENAQDATDVVPWKAFPETRTHRLLVSTEKAHSDKASLRMVVDIQPLSTDRSGYGGIGVLASEYPALMSRKLAACVAWVLLPTSEQAQASDMQAHIIAYTYDQSNNYMAIYSEDVKLVPGTWTPIFWGAAYTTEFKEFTFLSSDRKIHELYLNVWDYDKPYSGSVYIDDIIFYTYEQ